MTLQNRVMPERNKNKSFKMTTENILKHVVSMKSERSSFILGSTCVSVAYDK